MNTYKGLVVVAFWLGASGIEPLAAQESSNFTRRGDITSEKKTYSTNIDFDSSLIDGKKKAPLGFLLQGRNKQSLSNMVKLRRNFRGRLRNSSHAVKALAK